MEKTYRHTQKQVVVVSSICTMLIGLPAIAIPRMESQQPAQTNPRPSIFNEAPYNRGTYNSPLNPRPSIFNEPTYNRSTPSLTMPSSVIQPPLPEMRQAPSAMVVPMNGMVNIRLVNQTGADMNYQVIGDTEQRLLQGKASQMLQNLKTPLTLTFKRQDGGLLHVTPEASSEPGMLVVTFTETTDLGMDKNAMRVQATGEVFLN